MVVRSGVNNSTEANGTTGHYTMGMDTCKHNHPLHAAHFWVLVTTVIDYGYVP